MALQNAPIPTYTKQGRVWLQKSELNPYFLLHNHGMTGINWPASAPTAVRAQSMLQRSGNVVVDITEGDAELPVFTIPTRIAEVRNYLLSITGMRVNVQLATGKDGNPTQYGSSKLGYGWVQAMRGTATTASGASLDNSGENPPVPLESPFAAVVGPIPIDWGVALERITAIDTFPARGCFFLPPLMSDDPARRTLPGEVGMIVHDSDAGPALSEIYYTKNGFRSAVVNVTTDPFAAGIDSTCVVGYGDKYENRFIVGSETVAAPTVAYTDNYGVTWSTVALGANAGDLPLRACIVDASHIYFVGGQAALSKWWMSTSGGSSFTEYAAPVLAQPLSDICVMGNGVGYMVGASNVMAKCTDWDNFTAITGPNAGVALNCVAVKASTGTVFVGCADGKLFSSIDGGVTWVNQTATIQGYTATAINRIKFDPSGEFGYMVVTTAAAVVILRTTDGGASWKRYSLGTAGLANTAKNDLQVIGPNHIVAVGAVSTTATYLKAESNFDGGKQL